MRNLKKVLSLALAMVMLLGMMVVGAGAATEFKDADSIDDNRKVAAAVASAIEVLVGDENGNFNPDGTLTRAEAAVVLARLDLGADAAKALVATNAASFDDVADGSGYGWAKAYIDYCAGNGYIVGDGNGKFNPGAKVSSVQFGLMVSRVLGYDTKNEKIDGASDWIVKGAALARKAGLGTDVVVANADMTRADMAQMVLNALTAPMVEYNGLNISGDGFNVSSPATTRKHANDQGNTTNDYKGDPIVPNITPIRLCEEKFPYLKLSTTEEDSFGHTAAVWKYRNAEIINSETTVPADITICDKVGNSSKYPDWARIKDLDYKRNDSKQIIAKIFINGYELPRSSFPADDDGNTMAAFANTLTGNGRQVEIYLNEKDLTVIDKVVIIDTALAEVTKVVDSDETISVKLVKSAVTDGNVVLNTKIGFGEFNKGDLVLVQGYSTADTVLNAKTTITSVAEATKVTGFATVKKYDNDLKATYITVEGEDYYDAKGVMKDFAVNNFNLNTEFDSTLYLDKYGYIMKAIQGKDPNATTDNLVAVKRAYKTLTGGEIVDMIQGVLSNGQTVTWAVTEDATLDENHVREYRKVTSGKNSGKYELIDVAEKSTVTDPKKDTSKTYVANVYNGTGSVSFKSNDVYGGKGTYGNQYMYSDTVKFIFVNNEGVTVVNGRQNYDFVADKEIDEQVIAQALKDGEITAVFVESKADVADLNDVIYIHSRNREWDEVIDGKNGKVQYYGYTAYNAKGEAIDHFLAVEKDMADSYIVADKNEDGAYKNTHPKMLDTHTMTNGVVAKANGLSGDAFVLVQYSKDSSGDYTVEGAHYDFLGRSGTKVVDLTDKKLYIESVSEINEAVNNGYRVEVAVIYNNTETDARPESEGKVRVPVTVFVTGLTKNGEIPDHGTGEVAPTEDYEVTVNFTDTQAEVKNGTDTVASGTKITVKGGETLELTITAKDGYEIKEVKLGDEVLPGKDNVYTISKAGTVTVTTTEKVANAYTLTLKDGATTPKLVEPTSATNAANTTKVYVGDTLIDNGGTVVEKLGYNETTYAVKAGTKVTIKGAGTDTITAINDGTYIVDGVAVTVSGTKTTITFIMPETDFSIALDGTAGDKFVAKDGTTKVDTAMYAINLGTGLTAVQKESDKANTAHKTETINGVLYATAGTVLTVNTDKYALFDDVDDVAPSATQTGVSGAEFTVQSASANLLATAAITVNGGSGTDTVNVFAAKTGGSAETASTNVVTVRKGATVYVAPTAAADGDGVLVGTAKVGTGLVKAAAGDNGAAYEVTDDVTMSGAFKITKTDAVKVMAGTAEVSNGQYVAKGTDVTATLADDTDTNKVVVDVTAGDNGGVLAAVGSSDVTPSNTANTSFEAWTKVTGADGYKLQARNKINELTGTAVSLSTGALDAGVQAGTNVTVTGTAVSGDKIKVNGQTDIKDYPTEGFEILSSTAGTGATAGQEAKATITVRDKALTITQGA